MLCFALGTRLVTASLLAIVFVVLSGCGGPSASEDAEFQSLYRSLGRLLDHLDQLKDAEGLKQAKPELDKLVEEIEELHQKVKGYPSAKRQTLYERHSQLIRETETKHMDQVKRAMADGALNMLHQYLMVVAESDSKGKYDVLAIYKSPK